MRTIAKKKARRGLLVLAATAVLATAAAAAPEKTECLVGAKPGGGFDLTCRLAANALTAAKLIDRPMAVTYMEGGVGAVAYNHVVGTRPGDAGLVTAASSGSALLLAQKKFGNHDADAVRWVASVSADYGIVAVAADSPYKTLKDLVEAFRKAPGDFPIGGGGAVGSQDWMKAAVLAKAAGIPAKTIRYVALEGGGAVQTNLQGGFIKIASGDASEMVANHKAGKIRILAVMADQRLPGDLAEVPTAREQGFDLVWPIWRGFYVGPKVSDADYAWWVETFRKLTATPEFRKEREARGLYAFDELGAAFDATVKKDVRRFRELAREAGL
ncbi:tripartite tricarboxylate transporter substrate-binding protein [Chelatococcus sp. SYSU_G07232]|uniref:Tripartite tricarboxylate transporter substrate-binding protein n=1 Tax=Chelatococcus albus TaxID=3047466 RepID=A0ABT7ABR6_9HYPH|nr:tripartite tricarboxylate transporter substrate-binding protein [Chelatococcus sp. SYSU_G07232]MDJ1156807.1 tripartite tricarboxylate transporter substrate-binding protein [Chelatococcus sp. SYSU_G07232]